MKMKIEREGRIRISYVFILASVDVRSFCTACDDEMAGLRP